MNEVKHNTIGRPKSSSYTIPVTISEKQGASSELSKLVEALDKLDAEMGRPFVLAKIKPVVMSALLQAYRSGYFQDGVTLSTDSSHLIPILAASKHREQSDQQQEVEDVGQSTAQIADSFGEMNLG